MKNKQTEISETEIDLIEEKIVDWADVKSASSFINLDDFRTRSSLTVTNVRVVKVMKKLYQSEEIAEQLEIRMDVTTLNGKTTEQKIWTTSKRFMEAFREQLEKAKVPLDNVKSQVFNFKIKKIGEKTSVNYDVEDFIVVS